PLRAASAHGPRAGRRRDAQLRRGQRLRGAQSDDRRTRPDSCIDAVGMETHRPGPLKAYDYAKQTLRTETDRPIALREALLACRNGGTVSVAGVYSGFIDKFPIGAVMNRSLTIKSGQTHVQRYMRLLLERVEKGEIDPSFVVTHHLPLA